MPFSEGESMGEGFGIGVLKKTFLVPHILGL